MLDRGYIGHRLPAFDVTIEATQLRFFSRAIGETDPVYFDVESARAAGYPHLPVPPTFLFCLEFDVSVVACELVGIEVSRALHGEQQFHYYRMAFAGECLNYAARIADIYDKKNGALEFVVRETRATDAAGEPVADLRTTTVVRKD